MIRQDLLTGHFFQVSQWILNPVVLTWLHDPLLSIVQTNVWVIPALMINIILGKLILPPEKHCAKVLSYLIPLNAVPTRGEDEAKRDFPVCIQGESHNACSGAVPWLLSDLPWLQQSTQSNSVSTFSSREGPEQGVRGALLSQQMW